MISEEEANAQIERLQQRLTLNLQEIDKNFTDCNQVLTSRIIPEVEKYADSTLRIWNHSKIWLYFFRSLNKFADPTPSVHSEEGTNRPAHDNTIDSDDKWKHDVTMKDITRFSRLRMNLQPPSVTSQESRDFYEEQKPINNEALIRSISTDSTDTSYRRTYQKSPPRSVPFAPSSRSLIGTPIREQAKILADNMLQTVGIRSSDEEDSNHEIELESLQQTKKRRTEQKKPAQDKGKSRDMSWDDTDMMATDDLESRNKFNIFVQKRQNRYQNISQFEELPERVPVHSPSSRYDRHASPNPLVSTTTISRVLEAELQSNPESPTFMDLTPLRPTVQENDENRGAYEFAGELSQKIYNKEVTDTPSSKNTGGDLTTSSNMTMMSGYTGQIPAKFALNYFPEKFRVPPASTQLLRIYHFFADRPGVMITINDIQQEIKEPDYSKDNVQLLINLLVRKKFLKRVGDKDAWTVRR